MKQRHHPQQVSQGGGKLRFIPLGGVGNVTQNMFVYEYGNDIIVVDCGLGFPEAEMLGVDIVIPDISYLRENREKIRGIIITHGHEDHFGALPYFLPELNVPVYSTQLVQGFIRAKLKEYNALSGARLHLIDINKDVTFSIGAFKVTPFLINHSVPEAIGICLETPVGKVFHVADFKFDWTPVDGRHFEVGKLALLAKDGALLLASDCLGSSSKGYTQSERSIEEAYERLIGNAPAQVFVTTISSNIFRMKQAIRASLRHGRVVCFLGRSIEQNVEVAYKLGYLDFPKDAIVPTKRAIELPLHKVTYLVAGSYGQPDSALSRIANDDHQYVKVKKEAVVIFSADPSPPGVKDNVDFVVDRLTTLGADVHYYEIQENLHVSGHGSEQDIKMLMGIVQPKFFIPIGGSPKHMRAYKTLANEMGARPGAVFELSSGKIVEFTHDSAHLDGQVQAGNVLVDGLGVGDVGQVVLRDRQVLAKDGVVVVIVPLEKRSGAVVGKLEIISRGFVYMKESKELIEEAERRVRKTLEEHKEKIPDLGFVKGKISDTLEKFLYKKTERRPMVLPIIIEL